MRADVTDGGSAGFASPAVRVVTESGAVIGAGFVVGPRLIATCAHVVSEAAGSDAQETRPPSTAVWIDFPLLPGAVRVAARVRRWAPITADGGGDIAVLEIVDALPEPVVAPPFWRADEPWGREFRMLGFPAEFDTGVWVSGEFRAAQGVGWLQLQAATGGQPITGGFSGAAVWDAASGAVVGMAVAADRRRYTRTAFMIPIAEVLGIDPAMLPNPYRGLERFEESDAPLFHGRDADIERVLTALEQRSFVAVVGGSGTGKSSLVSAGVVPRVRARGMAVAAIRLTGLSVTSNSRVHDGDPVDLVMDVVWQTADRGRAAELVDRIPDEGLLVFSDQFEDLAATAPAQAQDLVHRLIELVAAARDSGKTLRVVMTLRWEAVGELVDTEIANLLDGATVALAAMEREQLRDVIRGPLAHAPGVGIDADLVERLVDDTVHQPGGLPLLESTLTELWEQRGSGRLTLADYQRSGGVAGAITRRADRALARFTEPEAAAARRLLTMIAVPIKTGTGFVRSAVALADHPDLHGPAGHLARERLVAVDRRSDGVVIVELAHQALIDNWPTLRGWLEYDRDFRSWQQEFDNRRLEWEAAQHDSGALLRGSALATAEEWSAARASDLSAAQHRFVQASRRVRRREVRRWRIVTAVTAVLALVAATTAVVAYRTGQERAEQLRLAAGINLAKESMRLADLQPLTALQFAQAAQRHAPGHPEVEDALLHQQASFGAIADFIPGELPTGRGRIAAAASADGDALAAVGTDGAVRVQIGLHDGNPALWRVPVDERVVAVAMSDDGGKIAVIERRGHVSVWDVRSRTGPVHVYASTARELTDFAIKARLSADGGVLVLSIDPERGPGKASAPDLIEVYDMSTPHPTRIAVLPPAADRRDQVPRYVGTGGTEVVFEETDGVEIFNVVRDLGGNIIRMLPDGFPVRGSIYSCLPPEPNRPRRNLAVYDVRTGVERFRFDVDRDFCTRAKLDSSEQYFIDADNHQHDAVFSLTLMSLRTGRTYRAEVGRSTGQDSTIITDSDQGPVVNIFADQGLLRFSPATPVDADPFTEEPAVTAWSGNAETVATYTRDAAAATGRLEIDQVRPRLRRLAQTSPGGPADDIDLGDRPVMAFTPDDRYLVAVGNRPLLVVFDARTLEVVHRIPLPVPAELGNPEGWQGDIIFAGPDEVLAMYGGTLTRWRIGDARPLSEPLRLWRDRDDLVLLSAEGALGRPAAPGEILVTSSGSAAIWNLSDRQRVRTYDYRDSWEYKGAYFDPIDPVVYVATDSVQIWNPATGEVTQLSQPMPSLPYIHGTTPGGLWVATDGAAPKNLDLWDRNRGRIATLQLPGYIYDVGVDKNMVHILYSGGVLRMNLDRENMFDRLCAIHNRDYTAAERARLPVGADDTPPCRK
ncbi:serine protease [Nocardia wallacei]|uniref:serine protease n=1 Tax=Nocardia wallacei TaxID=480035 RepID=UPI002453F103|nr:serine protease [Nocardia wallacei]